MLFRLTRLRGDIYCLENLTLGIDLSKDWVNSTVQLVQTTRPNDSVPLNLETLWWSETQDTIYRFGGEISDANGTKPADGQERIATVPPESIWQFKPDGRGSGDWIEALGPDGRVPYPPGYINTARGASASSGGRGYYIGGYASPLTTRVFSNLAWATLREAPGLQTFDFDTLSLTNTTDGGFFASQYQNNSAVFDPGNMVIVPSFGVDGLVILLGGSGYSSAVYQHQFESGVGLFNNVTIYDLHTGSWLWQTTTSTTGLPPMPRGSFCAVGVQGGDNSTFEM